MLNIDVEEFDESITYTGAGAAENNILAQKYMINESLIGDQKEFYSQDEEAFIAATKMIKDSTQSMINNGKASKSFSDSQLKDADYNYIVMLMNYEDYHAYYTQNREFKVSEKFESAQLEYTIDDQSAFKNSKNYVQLVNTVFDEKVDEEMDSNTTYNQAIFKVAKAMSTGFIKNELLNGNARYMISPKEDLEEVYQTLMAEVSDTAYQAKYTSQYIKMKKLLKGNPSPTFTAYENHAGGTTSFEDLKGKYTYIDVWATWCGPCIRAIPALKEVEKAYHGRNIQFVSISIDTEKAHETWVNMVNDKELGGIQLIAENAWQSEFTRAYEINSIPRFLLIDPDGNIVSADAKRPSDPGLVELFEELGI